MALAAQMLDSDVEFCARPARVRRGIRGRNAQARRFRAWAAPFSRPLFERAGMPPAAVVPERFRISGDAAAALRDA